MTDNEIIKALECCSKDDIGCEECPANGICDNDDYCVTGAILALINRQKAEIDELNHDVESLYRVKEQLKDMYKTAKTEAIKEFVERLKKTMAITFERVDGSRGYQTEDYFIDNLVEEMTEGGE